MALATRNAAHAESFFANELENLLSSSSKSGDGDEGKGKGKEQRSADDDMSDYSDFTVTPLHAPASATAKPTTAATIALSMGNNRSQCQSSAPLSGSGRRPVAADFESDTSSAGMSFAANGKFRPDNRPMRLVVNISDSEGDGETGDEGVAAQNGTSKARGQRGGGRRSGHATPVLDASAAELEEKEAEIRRMMEKIAQIEKKKSKSAVGAGGIKREDEGRAGTPMAELRVEMEKLEGERRELLASSSSAAAVVATSTDPARPKTEDDDEDVAKLKVEPATAVESALSRSPSIASTVFTPTAAATSTATSTAASSFVASDVPGAPAAASVEELNPDSSVVRPALERFSDERVLK
jgi:hypothetical protein